MSAVEHKATSRFDLTSNRRMLAIHVCNTEDRASSPYISQGRAALYYLEEAHEGHHWVWLSAVTVMGAPETYAFPSDQHGIVSDYPELPMSQKGTLSHEEILRQAGYVVVRLSESVRNAIEDADIELLSVLADDAEEQGLETIALILRALTTLNLQVAA